MRGKPYNSYVYPNFTFTADEMSTHQIVNLLLAFSIVIIISNDCLSAYGVCSNVYGNSNEPIRQKKVLRSNYIFGNAPDRSGNTSVCNNIS